MFAPRGANSPPARHRREASALWRGGKRQPCGLLPPKVAKRPGGGERNEQRVRVAPSVKIERPGKAGRYEFTLEDLRVLQTSPNGLFDSLRPPPPPGRRAFFVLPAPRKKFLFIDKKDFFDRKNFFRPSASIKGPAPSGTAPFFSASRPPLAPWVRSAPASCAPAFRVSRGHKKRASPHRPARHPGANRPHQPSGGLEGPAGPSK